MTFHRVLTIAMVVLVALHIGDVGIQLLDGSVPTNPPVIASSQTLFPGSANEAGTTGSDGSFAGVTLTDGVYEGSATGYCGDITVSVTVSDEQVTDIDILDETDTASYFRRAETIVDTIIDQQSLAVNAVSGATYSSAGIVNAVSDALGAAVGSGTLAVTEFTYSSNQKRHRHQ